MTQRSAVPATGGATCARLQPCRPAPYPCSRHTPARRVLPLMIGWFALNVPSGLSLYYFSNTLFTTASQVYLKKLGGGRGACSGWGGCSGGSAGSLPRGAAPLGCRRKSKMKQLLTACPWLGARCPPSNCCRRQPGRLRPWAHRAGQGPPHGSRGAAQPGGQPGWQQQRRRQRGG